MTIHCTSTYENHTSAGRATAVNYCELVIRGYQLTDERKCFVDHRVLKLIHVNLYSLVLVVARHGVEKTAWYNGSSWNGGRFMNKCLMYTITLLSSEEPQELISIVPVGSSATLLWSSIGVKRYKQRSKVWLSVRPGQPQKSPDNQKYWCRCPTDNHKFWRSSCETQPQHDQLFILFHVRTTKNLDGQPEIVTWLSVGQPFIFP